MQTDVEGAVRKRVATLYKGRLSVECIVNYPMIINPRMADWLKGEGMWNDAHMIVSHSVKCVPDMTENKKKLPECPAFLKEGYEESKIVED